jgi:hypothetical protein
MARRGGGAISPYQPIKVDLAQGTRTQSEARARFGEAEGEARRRRMADSGGPYQPNKVELAQGTRTRSEAISARRIQANSGEARARFGEAEGEGEVRRGDARRDTALSAY